MKQSLAVICADVGSVAKGNFGWWSSAGESGDKPSTMVAHAVGLLNGRQKIALGFECPLFVPLAANEAQLTSGRPGEGSRAWSAGAGCGALATGLVQVTWVLQERRRSVSMPAYVSWLEFAAASQGLFLWEAFVTGTAKSNSHTGDAQAGAEAFIEALPNPPAANAIACVGAVHSLLGAALLRTGWSNNLAVLQEPCLVVRARPNVV